MGLSNSFARAFSSNVRMSLPHSTSVPASSSRRKASSYVMRGKGGSIPKRRSTSRSRISSSGFRSSTTVLHTEEMSSSPCCSTASMPSQAISISACQYSVRWRVVRDFSALKDGATV